MVKGKMLHESGSGCLIEASAARFEGPIPGVRGHGQWVFENVRITPFEASGRVHTPHPHEGFMAQLTLGGIDVKFEFEEGV
jgi:hypothetical protein